MKKLSTIAAVITAALSLLLTIGIKTVFPACEHKTDTGMWMSCHWAEQAVFAAGIGLCCAGVLAVIVRSPRVRAGVSLGMIPAAISAMLIPNIFINLCMKTDMQCHSVMRPAVMLICGAVAAAAAVTAFLSLKAKERSE